MQTTEDLSPSTTPAWPANKVFTLSFIENLPFVLCHCLDSEKEVEIWCPFLHAEQSFSSLTSRTPPPNNTTCFFNLRVNVILTLATCFKADDDDDNGDDNDELETSWPRAWRLPVLFTWSKVFTVQLLFVVVVSFVFLICCWLSTFCEQNCYMCVLGRQSKKDKEREKEGEGDFCETNSSIYTNFLSPSAFTKRTYKLTTITKVTATKTMTTTTPATTTTRTIQKNMQAKHTFSLKVQRKVACLYFSRLFAAGWITADLNILFNDLPIYLRG